jgi:hypothetical protein
MKRKLIVAGIGAAVLTATGALWLTHGSPKAPLQPVEARQGQGDAAASALPLSQIVLFSSGVGYFQREGDVEGNARIDMQFPIDDVNDILKSLVLQDMGKGKIGAISYDGQDPIEKTLRSFAVDLTGNPTIGQVLNQARGEKVEVVMQSTAANTPGTLTGVVMGMESEMQPVGPNAAKEVHMLNLVCAEGLRSVNLREVQRIRFTNAKLDQELRRALEVLASAHDSLKKSVSLNFKGDGKRKVRVGYVSENPIWKTSYRLTVDGKSNLQAWASVENVTDEDWNDVRVVLVSGRPISFQMDLYPPLFVPRPTVEPEKFASLRPPMYNGALTGERLAMAGMQGGASAMNLGFGGQGGNLGFGGGGFNQNLQVLGGGQQFGMQGQFGLNQSLGVLGQQNFNRYQNVNPQLVNGQFNPQWAGNNAATPQAPGNAEAAQQQLDNNLNMRNSGRLSYEQLQERRNSKNNDQQKQLAEQTKKVGNVLANLDPHDSIAAAAASEEIGDAFRYVIEEKVSLPRQKSALLPLMDKTIDATRVSIFNETVHSKFPLLGLRFKNTSGQPLTQGPITVFEEGSYAGDARLPDMQPDEERLLSYAVDLGTEVLAASEFTPGSEFRVRTDDASMVVQYTVKHSRKYTIRNRSKQDRTIVIEHPIRPNWSLSKDQKAREQSRDVYRFDVSVPAGKTTEFKVGEEMTRTDPFSQQWSKQQQEVIETRFQTNLNLEVERLLKTTAPDLQNVKIVKGELHSTAKHEQSKLYRVHNRSKEDRKLTIEHRVAALWKVVGDLKPVEGTENRFDFPMTVVAGKVAEKTVNEERTVVTIEKLAALNDEKLQEYLKHKAVSEKVKAALTLVAGQKEKLADIQRQTTEKEKLLKEIADDQARLRQNLDKVPSTSAAYKRYLEKFDKQETQIEELQAALKTLAEAAKKQQKELTDSFANLSVE